jgi:phage terminase small subunit
MIEAKPPAGLRTATKRWWTEVVSSWELDVHHLKLLEAACRELDRAEEARLEIRKAGSTVIKDRWNQLKEHPSRKIEREARITFARLVRELGLDVEESSTPRPPTLTRNGGYRA